jgi:hypothetical protein
MHRTPAQHTATRIPSRADALSAPWSGTRLAPPVVHSVSFSRLPTTTGPLSGQPMELRTPFECTRIDRPATDAAGSPFEVDFSDLVPVRVPRPRSVSETR